MPGACPAVWRRRSHALALGTLLLSSALACTHVAPIESSFVYPPLVEPIPTVVGVYYSPQLREYNYRVRQSRLIQFDLFPGPPSMSAFDHAFRGLFETVHPLPSMAGPLPSDLSAIIAVEVEDFEVEKYKVQTVDEMREKGIWNESVAITYRLKLFSPDGSLLASWSSTGIGHGHQTGYGDEGIEPLLRPEPTFYGDCAELAIREAVAKFLVSFREVPGVADWLQIAGLDVERSQTRAAQDEEMRRQLRLEIERARQRAEERTKELEIQVKE